MRDLHARQESDKPHGKIRPVQESGRHPEVQLDMMRMSSDAGGTPTCASSQCWIFFRWPLALVLKTALWAGGATGVSGLRLRLA